MTWWAYSAHWSEEGVTITVSVEASTDRDACAAGRRRIADLFPGRSETRTSEMAEDMTEKLARAAGEGAVRKPPAEGGG